MNANPGPNPGGGPRPAVGFRPLAQATGGPRPAVGFKPLSSANRAKMASVKVAGFSATRNLQHEQFGTVQVASPERRTLPQGNFSPAFGASE